MGIICGHPLPLTGVHTGKWSKYTRYSPRSNPHDISHHLGLDQLSSMLLP